MLRINREGLSPEKEIQLSSLLEAMKGQSDQDIAKSLNAFSDYAGRARLTDNNVFDRIDEIVLVTENQALLLLSWENLHQRHTSLLENSTFTIRLSDDNVKVVTDHMNRLVANVQIKLWDNDAYMQSQKDFERAKNNMWRLWYELIPESIVPAETVDKRGSHGALGSTRKVPGWVYRDGKIVSRRAEL